MRPGPGRWRRAIETLRQPVEIEGVAIGGGTSIGIVCHDGHAIDPEELLRGADIALYRAKGDGRGRAVHYDHEMGEPVRRRLELRNASESALDGVQLEVHYQPLFRLADRSVFGLEALMRWHHPEKGSIAPAEFYPRRRGVPPHHHPRPLGPRPGRAPAGVAAAHERAMGGADDVGQPLPPPAARPGAGAQPRPPPGDRDPAPHPGARADRTGRDRQPRAAVEVFRRLKDLGVRLAVHDYGSGNASISYLRQFPIDELKIDRRGLIDPLGVDRRSPTLW